MSRMSFEIVTGRLGVGAIAFLGLFLIVDGMQIGVFKMIETYGKSTTWGIIGVIPNRAKALSAAVQNQGTFTAQPVNSADPKDRAAD